MPARRATRGLLDVHVHDLRAWTRDRHHTVDDSPYGGGAGMVMKPEPWGEALDEVLPDDAILVVPTPSGTPFSQALARELAGHDHLVFACGRYEGIDQRVIDQAAERADVREISIGDYVLNGGEVAALAITEAVVRLLPGFMGNPGSLLEESHEDGLLEYPVYTKPASWRGRDVPPVLLSGDHAAIAAWRHEQSVRRTAERRPDLRAPVDPAPATSTCGWSSRATRASCSSFSARAGSRNSTTTRESGSRRWRSRSTTCGPGSRATSSSSRGRPAGWSVPSAASLRGEEWDIGRLMVAPDVAGRGLGRSLLARIEAAAPPEATSYALFTGAGSARNQRMYKKAGYRLRGEIEPGVVRMTKKR